MRGRGKRRRRSAAACRRRRMCQVDRLFFSRTAVGGAAALRRRRNYLSDSFGTDPTVKWYATNSTWSSGVLADAEVSGDDHHVQAVEDARCAGNGDGGKPDLAPVGREDVLTVPGALHPEGNPHAWPRCHASTTAGSCRRTRFPCAAGSSDGRGCEGGSRRATRGRRSRSPPHRRGVSVGGGVERVQAGAHEAVGTTDAFSSRASTARARPPRRSNRRTRQPARVPCFDTERGRDRGRPAIRDDPCSRGASHPRNIGPLAEVMIPRSRGAAGSARRPAAQGRRPASPASRVRCSSQSTQDHLDRAAIGIAPSAPTTPASSAPIRTATSTARARAAPCCRDERLENVVLELLVEDEEDEQHDPGGRRVEEPDRVTIIAAIVAPRAG